MTQLQSCSPTDSLLRIVFDHSVVSRAFAGTVTLGEVARMLGRRASRRYGSPIAISFTLGRSGDEASVHALASPH